MLNMNIDLDQLKKINWKRHLNTTLKVLTDFKVLGLLTLSGLTAYGIGWDTVIRPGLEGLHSRDNFIKEQNEALEKKQRLQREYGDLEQRLTNLETHLITFRQGSSSKIVSVTEAAELTDMAMGKIRAANLPPLQPPHDVRDHVDLKPAETQTIDILHPNGDAPAPEPNPAAPPEAGAAGLGSGASGPGGGADAGVATTLPVERYNYTLSVTGTYPALMDLLNQLITRKKLLKINKVTISKSAFEMADTPDPKEYPDFPLKLDMVVSLSMFLYEDNNVQPDDAK